MAERFITLAFVSLVYWYPPCGQYLAWLAMARRPRIQVHSRPSPEYDCGCTSTRLRYSVLRTEIGRSPTAPASCWELAAADGVGLWRWSSCHYVERHRSFLQAGPSPGSRTALPARRLINFQSKREQVQRCRASWHDCPWHACMPWCGLAK
ncbi:uncharacterized protein BDZ83DRAFT_246818 [Colletotrichum acutatum]|uniref:Uncharacterized protein n=1 Tax=Glomerella acutata TaxID=27357 RepID=A0AAD9D367_GLOAC|nr:uncharacterized protein BDZ83DRAFT_246818 [Colletotrichum acutatum]KAK1731350.1 hypothetical protein BDZ83DRAFT_246818 [Colletotrichum acutatum]